ncbi:MAG: hypothetical protein KAI71_01815 [Candidatus Pacebacteria bacterium]|nr:hypothetical protein [Candidatus Paceibacterota bacterium]
MVKISITLGAKDETVSDKLIEAVGRDMASLIEDALNGTNDPVIAMTVLKKELSELYGEIILKYKARGIVE